jgi:predicted outer membrane repeat protein
MLFTKSTATSRKGGAIYINESKINTHSSTLSWNAAIVGYSISGYKAVLVINANTFVGNAATLSFLRFFNLTKYLFYPIFMVILISEFFLIVNNGNNVYIGYEHLSQRLERGCGMLLKINYFC